MFILKICGGLGNQMFQYAFGYTISQIFNLEMKLDLSWFDNIGLNTTNRSYQLGIFNIKHIIATTDEIEQASKTQKTLLDKLNKALFKTPYKEPYVIRENTLEKLESLKSQSNEFIIDGYWQNEEYFLSHKNEIIGCFNFPKFTNSENSEIRKIIKSEPGAVSIHVRRGDYLTDSKINAHHGLCSMDYYDKAINDINQKVTNPVFFIFSDDPEWCKEAFSFLGKGRFYIINSNLSENVAFRDMQLMSLCNHHIIANSSFSWWGAWLADSKVVIAPKKWFNNENQTSIVPKNWITY